MQDKIKIISGNLNEERRESTDVYDLTNETRSTILWEFKQMTLHNHYARHAQVCNQVIYLDPNVITP